MLDRSAETVKRLGRIVCVADPAEADARDRRMIGEAKGGSVGTTLA
jgi:hypothetical protein